MSFLRITKWFNWTKNTRRGSHTHARMHAHTHIHTRVHGCTHAHTHTHTHTHTQTHTHTLKPRETNSNYEMHVFFTDSLAKLGLLNARSSHSLLNCSCTGNELYLPKIFINLSSPMFYFKWVVLKSFHASNTWKLIVDDLYDQILLGSLTEFARKI